MVYGFLVEGFLVGGSCIFGFVFRVSCFVFRITRNLEPETLNLKPKTLNRIKPYLIFGVKTSKYGHFGTNVLIHDH